MTKQLYIKDLAGNRLDFYPVTTEKDVLPAQGSSTIGKALVSNGVNSEWEEIKNISGNAASASIAVNYSENGGIATALANKADVSLDNIDEAGEQKIIDVINLVPATDAEIDSLEI